jgi:hypothetical protein
MEVGGQCLAPAALPQERGPVHTVQQARWAPGLSGWGQKISYLSEFDLWTVQPALNCYTDYNLHDKAERHD